MGYIAPTWTRGKVKVFYETSTGLEEPSLRIVNEVDRRDENSAHHDYDFILRGEVDGWSTNNMVISWNQLDTLLDDIKKTTK